MAETGDILTRAKALVQNRRYEYGPIEESFKRVAEACIHVWGIRITDTDIVKILITLKLVREGYQHKEDNLLDAAGYQYILDLMEGSRVKTDEVPL